MPTLEGMTSGCSDNPDVMVHKNSGSILNLQERVDKLTSSLEMVQRKNDNQDEAIKEITESGNKLGKLSQQAYDTAEQNRISLKHIADNAKSQMDASREAANSIQFK